MAIHSCNELKIVVAGLGNFGDISQHFWFLFPIEKPILNCLQNWVQIEIWPDLTQPHEGADLFSGFQGRFLGKQPPLAKEPTSCLYLYNSQGKTAGPHEDGWEDPMIQGHQ